MSLTKLSGRQIETPVDISAVNLTGITTAANLNVTGVSTLSSAIVGSAVTITSGGIVAGLGTVNNFNVTHINISGVTTVAAGSVSAPSITPTGDTDTGIFFPAADTIAFGEGGAEALRINSSGNLGIGTANPSNKLHVTQTANRFFYYTSTGNIEVFGPESGNDGNYVRLGASYNQLGLYASNTMYFNTSNTGGFVFGQDGSERLRIDSSGRLLLGASGSSANTRVVVQGNSSSAAGTAEMHLQYGSPTTNILNNYSIANLNFSDSAGNVGATIRAQADANWGASSFGTRIMFLTTATGASSPTERMRITNSGGIFANGATSPVAGNANDGIHIGTAGSALADYSLTLGDAVATARWRIVTGNYRLNFSQNDGSGTYNIRAYVNDSTGAYVQVSDERAKKEVADSIYGIADLKKLRPVSYLMNSQDKDSARRNLGFIAQEVLEVIPEAVNKPEDEQQMYGLESIALIPVLVSSLQEAVAKIESLEARLSALEAQ